MRAPFAELAFVVATVVLFPRSALDFWRFTSWDVPKELEARRFSADISADVGQSIG